MAVVGTKGGVGKTTTAMYLAAGLARTGRTLLVDTDPQGSAQSWAAQAGDGLDFGVVGVTQGIPRQVAQLAADYAHVVIDTPPGRGDRGISLAALLCVDTAVVPLAPSLLEADRLQETIDLLASAQASNDFRIRVLLTRVRAGTRMADLVPKFLTELQLPLIEATVGLRERYATAFGTGIADLGEYGPVLDSLLELAASGVEA